MNDSETPLSNQQNDNKEEKEETSMAQPSEPSPTSTPEPAPEKPTAPLTTPPMAIKPAEVTTSSKKSKHLWLYLVIVIVIIAAGVGAWYATRNKNSTSSSVNTKKDISLLTYGYNNNPLNVFYPSSSANTTLAVSEQIFEGLVKFNNGTQIVPDLAASWTNPNTTTWDFTLQPNVLFHDGDTVTAQDVVYTWQQINANNPQIASYATSTIKDVTALNTKEVEITTTAPDPVLLNRLTNLWIVDSKAKTGTQPWDLGTGAYTVKPNTTPSTNAVDLVAFNNWHGGNIYTKAINYVFYADPSKATTALNAGQIDLADNLSTANATQLSKTNYQVLTPPSLLVDFIGFNNVNKSLPTANAKIRQAIDLTIDPSAVLKAYGVSGNPIDQVIPPQLPGFNSAIVRPALNTTQAKQLVSSVYPNGVTIDFGVGEPALAAGQEIAKELLPIGITAKLDVATDEGTFFNNINNGVYSAFYFGNGSSIADASDVLGGWQGAPFYDNTTFDSQLAKANQTFDPSQRLTELQQASQTLVSDNAYIPLFQHSYIFASKKGIVYPLGTYDNDINTFFSNVYQK